jgi:hypothetical protein
MRTERYSTICRSNSEGSVNPKDLQQTRPIFVSWGEIEPKTGQPDKNPHHTNIMQTRILTNF